MMMYVGGNWWWAGVMGERESSLWPRTCSADECIINIICFNPDRKNDVKQKYAHKTFLFGPEQLLSLLLLLLLEVVRNWSINNSAL